MTNAHGGNIYAHKVRADFSANINPLGTPKEVTEAAAKACADCAAYPDPFCTRLTAALSAHEGLPTERIVCGNGAADLIYRIVHALRPRRAELTAPAFSEYGAALGEVGCETVRRYLSAAEGFELTDRTAEELGRGQDTDIVFLCSPNNPTGRVIRPERLKRIAENCRERGVTLVIDECFLGFVRNGEEMSAKRFMSGNVIVLRAFTKLYAMAGLRLGYALFGSAELAEKVRGSGQYWSVSTPAQAAGEAALRVEGYAERTAEYICAEREYLTEELVKSGFEPFPSDANFVLFRAYRGLAEQLMKEGIMIRDCGNFEGLTDKYFRIAVRTHEENEMLTQAIKKITSTAP